MSDECKHENVEQTTTPYSSRGTLGGGAASQTRNVCKDCGRQLPSGTHYPTLPPR